LIPPCSLLDFSSLFDNQLSSEQGTTVENLFTPIFLFTTNLYSGIRYFMIPRKNA
jgi:hypothetical protein